MGPTANSGANSPEIIADLAPGDNELVVSSHVYDKFHDTPLDMALRSRDVRCLIVTGVVTEICVNATLMGAANRDYRVTVATDGVAPVSPELQEACFQIWQRRFSGWLRPARSWRFWTTTNETHQQFSNPLIM